MSGYVGRAPGTTTLHLGSPWAPGYPNPAQRYLPRGATVAGGMMAPHDLELAKIYGYTPYMQGWIVGRFTEQGPGISVNAVDDGLGGLGADATQADLERQLEMKRIEEELKSLRWNRACSALTAAAAVGALVISLMAYRRRR
jgi:hypothetical protein